VYRPIYTRRQNQIYRCLAGRRWASETVITMPRPPTARRAGSSPSLSPCVHVCAHRWVDKYIYRPIYARVCVEIDPSIHDVNPAWATSSDYWSDPQHRNARVSNNNLIIITLYHTIINPCIFTNPLALRQTGRAAQGEVVSERMTDYWNDERLGASRRFVAVCLPRLYVPSTQFIYSSILTNPSLSGTLAGRQTARPTMREKQRTGGRKKSNGTAATASAR